MKGAPLSTPDADATRKAPDQIQRPLQVAIIGCGPGGMFVCHAVETHRQRLLEELDQLFHSQQGRQQQNEDQVASLQSQLEQLPVLKCFEKDNAPGGVWRSSSSSASSSDACMYEALWCNGPKELMEFFDYTFQDHFGGALDGSTCNNNGGNQEVKLPVYLPRQAVLDYLLKRVTRHCPDFFDKYATFDTQVDQVTFDAVQDKFTVHSTHVPSQVSSSHSYDKVIWAAGENGMPKIPDPIQHAFDSAHQRWSTTSATAASSRIPSFLHAAAVQHGLDRDIRNRNLLLIGGSFSAEDLAFMGIKWGAKHITILARRQGIDVPICWTENWPDHKVTVITGYEIETVEIFAAVPQQEPDTTNNSSDGCQKDASYRITLKKNVNEIDLPVVEEQKQGIANENDVQTPTEPGRDSSPASATKPIRIHTQVIPSVHVVICCTGYKENITMLDKSCYNMTSLDYNNWVNDKNVWHVPVDWTMPDNPLSPVLGQYYRPAALGQCSSEEKKGEEEDVHIPPCRDLPYRGCGFDRFSHRDLVFLHNPHLMFLNVNHFDANLLAIDVLACLAARLLTGLQSLPTRQQMEEENRQQALHELSLPLARYQIDTNYHDVVQKWLACCARKVVTIDDNGQIDSISHEYPSEWEDAEYERYEYELIVLGRIMQEAAYPLQFLSSAIGSSSIAEWELNDQGEQFMKINWGARNEDTCPIRGTTFRDVTQAQCDEDGIASFYTGTKPVPLKGRWLDMDDHMENIRHLVL